MFEFNAYAIYETARSERERRLQRAALLAAIDDVQGSQRRRTLRAAALLIGAALARSGRALQQWAGRDGQIGGTPDTPGR